MAPTRSSPLALKAQQQGEEAVVLWSALIIRRWSSPVRADGAASEPAPTDLPGLDGSGVDRKLRLGHAGKPTARVATRGFSW